MLPIIRALLQFIGKSSWMDAQHHNASERVRE
jgi:hypothetical protein